MFGTFLNHKKLTGAWLFIIFISVLYSCKKGQNPTSGLPSGTNVGFPANPLNKPGYSIDFDDELNETTLDTSKFLAKYFPHTVAASSQGVNAKYNLSNGCLNIYIDGTTQAYFPGDLTHFMVSSIQTFEKNYLCPGAGTTNVTNVKPFNGYATQYGYFEMRAKLPNCGGGGHSSWWMIGCQDDADANGQNFTQDAEIDVTEPLYSTSNNSSPKLHPWSDSRITEFDQNVNNTGNPTTEYHIYAMDWTPSGIKFYYDNKLIASTDDSPNYRMCMLFSLYASYSTNYWSGVDNGVYPKTLSIDYIRVYKLVGGYTSSNYYYIRNRNNGQLLNLQNKTGKVERTAISPDSLSAQWSLETHDGYTRFKNRKTGDYINEQDHLNYEQYSALGSQDWISCDYSQVPNGGTYIYLENRATGNILNSNDNLGYAESTPPALLPTSWWGGDW